MRRIKHFLRKAWDFFRDDRVGLFLGGMVLVTALQDVRQGQPWWALFGVALCVSCVVPAWRSIGKAVRA